ncbi:site-specific integrase [Actinospica durhamensis]|uniref:Site-specific integrase n=1 Tax=Actinospica durhamensis TaxID=1508375 RepID=A0A941EZW0_9ACTN|nr:site-specific integrase [Actinospica durhamensis]MBR7837454.1 site-specific integrase [Actinospica durhamensis]
MKPQVKPSAEYSTSTGRWEACAYILGPGGTRRRVSVYAATRREAVTQLAEKTAVSRKGLPTRARIPTLADYLTWWLTEVEAPRVRPSTLELLRSTVDVHLTPGLGRIHLDKLSIADVRRFVTRLQTTCQCCAQNKERRRQQPRCCAIGQCCGMRLAPTTVHRIYQVLVAALSHAVREEYLHRNVAALVQVPTGRDGHKPRALTLDQARALLEAASDHRLYALVHLALLTGMRRGELLGLRWQDIDFDAGTLTIGQTLMRLVGTGITFAPPKTPSSKRVVALTDSVLTVLRHHKRRQNRERALLGARWHESGLVFTARNGKPLDPYSLAPVFDRFRTIAALPHFRLHDLRHTTATLLGEAGTELHITSSVLGHAHLGTTADIYSEIRPATQRAALTALEQALSEEP